MWTKGVLTVRGVRHAAVLALVLLASPAQAQSIVAHYDGAAYGVIALGKARIETDITGARYDATGTARTVGLAALFGKADISASATGDITEAAAAPAEYRLDHRYHGSRRLWRIDWSTPAVQVTSDPDIPYTGEIPTTEAQRREGRDPLSTIIAMQARVAATGSCAGAFRVFDGWYVYDLTTRDDGPGPNGGRYRQGDIDLPSVTCRMTQTRIAGYARRDDLAKKLPEGRITFVRLPDAPVALLATFSSGLPLGEATITLKKIERR